MDFEAALVETRVIPVVEIPRADDAVPLAAALAEAGLPCAEITFRTEAAEAAIAAIAATMPDFRVGAGTVLTVDQARRALDSGAAFLVAPDLDAGVLDFARRQDVPLLPGVCTPSEIGRALKSGLTVVKLFPAEAAGGIAYLEAVAAPFRAMRFVPTGGIGPDNLAAYLSHPQVLACGGSWMVKKQLIADGELATITAMAAEALALASAVPSGAPA